MADPSLEAIEDFARALPAGRGLFVAIGVFDGVHRGHRVILDRLLAEAAGEGAEAAVLTFHPHPLAILRPEAAPQLLMNIEDRVAALKSLGISRVLVVPFTTSFARLEPETFVDEVLVRRLRARRVYVGHSFTFGRGGRGNPGLLRRLGEPGGLEVREFALVGDVAGDLSSTGIRIALQQGRVADAARALGRPHVVQGVVEGGERRGRRLGFPTANLAEKGPIIWPADGVYAVAACCRQGLWGGVANLGRRPTVSEGGPRLLEVHLFDFSGSLYGESLRVAFLDRLRGERRFPDLEALRRQIAADAASARERVRAGWADLPREFLCRGMG